MESACMICLNSRSQFEDDGKSFSYHTKVEHEIWMYPFYVWYLKNTKLRDYDGTEIEVWTNYNENKVDWMPVGNVTTFLKVNTNFESFEIE